MRTIHPDYQRVKDRPLVQAAAQKARDAFAANFDGRRGLEYRRALHELNAAVEEANYGGGMTVDEIIGAWTKYNPLAD